MATSTTRSSEVGERAGVPRRAWLGLALAVLATVGAAARADEVVAPVAERIRAAPLIVEGLAGRGDASWDGADPATIVTYTPFTVTRVLKGALPKAAIVLRQHGGAVGGAEALDSAAAQFDDGERALVFVGQSDPRDASYDIVGGARGKYRITTDAEGQDGLDVRLGVDAAAFSSKEKAPGTLLGRLSLETFERLARGGENGEGRSAATPAPAAERRGAATVLLPAAVPAADGGGARVLRWVGLLLALAAAGLAIAWALFRVRRAQAARRAGPPRSPRR
jgi:hypothetical protein